MKKEGNLQNDMTTALYLFQTLHIVTVDSIRRSGLRTRLEDVLAHVGRTIDNARDVRPDDGLQSRSRHRPREEKPRQNL